MQEFRQRLLAFYQARQPLLDLKAKSQDMFSQWDEEDLRRQGESLLPALTEARDRVGQLMAEATEIANRYGMPTELQILPPPMIGGYGHTMNIFEAAIEFQLPFDFELEPRKVVDLVKQTTWAVERDIKTAQESNLSVATAKRAGQGIASGFRSLFKTETDRVILKWIVFIGLCGLILRYVFGIKFEIIAKLLIDKVAK